MSIGNKNKSDLNIFCQKSHIVTAVYTSAVVDGSFVSTVTVKGREYRSTSGYPTKKEAENDAAGVALINILNSEYGGKNFDEVVSLLELQFPSKNKKKAKHGVGLVEVTAQPQNTTSLPSEATPSAGTHQTTMAQYYSQSVPVSSLVEAGPHPQGGASTVPSYASVCGVHSSAQSRVSGTVPHTQQVVGGASVVMITPSQRVLPQQIQVSPNQMGAVSAHYESVALPTQQQPQPHPHSTYAPPTQGHPGVYAPPTHPYPNMGGGQQQMGIPPPTHSTAYLPPQRGVYTPRPHHTSASSVAPPPGFRPAPHPVASQFPAPPPTHPSSSPYSPPHPHQPPQSHPPGFSPQHPITASQNTPNKPLNAIPVSPGRQDLPAGVANQITSIDQHSEVIRPELNHIKALEVLCQRLNFSAPFYKVKESGRGQYTAEVTVNDRIYGSRWISNDFEKAKTVAAMEALSRMAFTLGTETSVSTGSTPKPQARGSSVSSAPPQQTPTTTPSSIHSVTPPIATPTHSPPSRPTPGQSSLTKENRELPQQTQLSSEVVLSEQFSKLKPPSYFAQSSSSTPAAAPLEEKKPPATMSALNYKQVLNIHCQKNHIPVAYECSASEDSVGYIATIRMSGRMFSSNPHGTKKAAETDAAEKAVKALGLGGTSWVSSGHQYQPHTGVGYAGVHGTAASSSQAQSAGIVSYKNLLQEHVQKQGRSLPHYETERVETGFKSTVRVHQLGGDSLTFTSSPQPVKKAAEQEAAKLACVHLNLVQ